MEQNTNITICGQDYAYENKCCCGCQDQEETNALDNIEIDATVDDTTGTPSVNVTKEDNKYTFNFSGLKGGVGETGADGSSITFDDLTEEQKAQLKGETGARGPQGNTGDTGATGAQGPKGHDGIDGAPGTYPQLRAQANIGNTIGDPSVRVSVEGTTDSPILNFYFDGIKGANGTNGTNGANGRDGRDGIDGINGIDGKDGKDGKDATVAQIENAVTNEVERQLDEFDDALEAASWLKYAIDGHEDDKQAFARLIASAREYDSTGKNKLAEAYAGVNALVTKNNDGTYTATSFLTSLVGGGEGEPQSQSGLITTSNLTESIADLYSQYTTDTKTIVARIFAIANNDGSSINIDADHVNMTASDINTITKNAAVEVGSLKVKAGTWDNNSNEILISGDSNGDLTLSARHLTLTSNSDSGRLYLDHDHIHVGNQLTSDITIGDPDALDCDVYMNGTITLSDGTETVSITATDVKRLLALLPNS